MRNIVLDNKQLKEISSRLGKEISSKFSKQDKTPVLVGVMKGALNFMFDLLPNITIPVYTDYMQIASYEGDKRGNGIKLLKDISSDCSNRDVIIVEDIVDTGYSMQFLIEHMKKHNPKNVYVCALLNKINAREVDVNIDFEGHRLEKNDFLIGYGLDYRELGRNLPYIFSAAKEDIAEFDKILSEK